MGIGRERYIYISLFLFIFLLSCPCTIAKEEENENEEKDKQTDQPTNQPTNHQSSKSIWVSFKYIYRKKKNKINNRGLFFPLFFLFLYFSFSSCRSFLISLFFFPFFFP
ncbi:hypothetical protein VTN96DRAFT_9595 [Rasamsonia emersonii]